MTKSNDSNSCDDVIYQLEDLQIKMAYLEDTIDQLNEVIARQDRELIDIKDQMRLMYHHLKQKDAHQVAAFDIYADKPPHY